MYSAMRAITPTKAGDTKIEVVFQNNSQLEEYQLRLKPLLVSEFKEAFNNHYIEISDCIADAEKLQKPGLLSDKEKLEKMIEKNPSLLQLKNKFKLDFE
jgi:hypothetical protein